MPNPLYIVPFGNRLDLKHLSDQLQAELLQLRADTALATFDDVAKTCNIYVDFKDLRFRYANIASVIVGFKQAVYVAEDFGTPALKARRKQMLDDARDGFRNTVYAPIDPATTTAVTPDMDQAAGLTALMANPGAGFCLGTAHDDLQSKAMLCDGLDSGTLANSLLFIEEIPTALQTVLKAWLEDGNNASPMPDALAKHIKPLDEQMARTANGPVARNFSALLQKAKEQNAKVFGIDGGDADAGVDISHAGFKERRDARMNKLAAGVIRKARDDNPGAKFVVSVGAAHMNSHEGGIPGIAQLFNIPGIIVDPANGKLVPQPDDPAKRTMPSREEQEFIDRYSDSLEAEIANVRPRLGDAGQLLQGEIYDNARTLAAKLRADGALPDIDHVDTALASREVRQRWTAYAKVIKAAPDTIEEAEVDKMVTDATGTGSPALCTMALRHVAGRSRGDLVDRLVPPGNVNACDENGDPPIITAVKRRCDRDDPRASLQGSMVRRLLTKGADPNLQGQGNRTAMHHAALNDNTQALDALHKAGGRTDIQDSRNWSAYDVAVGSTKVAAEQWFYDHGTANPPGVTGTSPTLSSVDALMQAVKCENPGDMAKVQAALTELYGNRDLRPVLDLVALDSLSPRDPSNGGGLRMYVANATEVSGLYNDPEKRMNAGYDDVAHVALFASQSSGDFAGEMIHELTHAAARIAYANGAQPFKPGLGNDYRQAVVNDVRRTTLPLSDDTNEEEIKRQISGRMGGYVLRYPKEAETKLMQEFIVNAPQLMAQLGSAEATKLVPGLAQYFRGPFADACQEAARADRFETARGKIDNSALIATAVPRQAAASPARVAAKPNTPDRVLGMMRDNYRAMYGDPTKGSALTPYEPARFQLSWGDEQAFQPRMQRVEKLLRKLLAEQGLPPELSVDGLRDLVTKMGAQIRGVASVKDIDELALDLATTWVRKAKEEYGSRPAKDGKLPDERALAEAIVIRAEDKVWNEGAMPDAQPGAVHVDPDKHNRMVSQLAEALGRLPGDQKADPGALVERLATALAGDKSKGFYRKPDKKTGGRAEHVSISEKDAKRVWLETLKAA